MNDLMSEIANWCSVRKYDQRPIPDDVLRGFWMLPVEPQLGECSVLAFCGCQDRHKEVLRSWR